LAPTQHLPIPGVGDTFGGLPRLVAMGASAGGLGAFSTILAALPKDFPAPIVIVQHLSADFPSKLAQILGTRTKLRVKEAAQGDRLRAGHVYVAPPGKHLLINPDRSLSLSLTAKVHHCRPSVDVLFRSAAACCAAGTIGVVLTDGDGDGAAGIQAIKTAGGITIVQDLPSSRQPSMPLHAAATGSVDCVLPLPDIARALLALVTPKAAEPEAEVSQTALYRVQSAWQKTNALQKTNAFQDVTAGLYPINRLVTTALKELDECLQALVVAEKALCAQNDALEDLHFGLRHESRRFQALLSFVSDAIITTDTKGIVRGVSPAAAAMLGLTARHLVGRPFASRARKGEALVFEKALTQALATGDCPQDLGLKVRQGLAAVSASASVIQNEQGIVTDLLWRLQSGASSTL